MNCLKCGAALEEGSTSTLCPACLALKEATPTGETDPPVTPEAPENPEPPVETPPSMPEEPPAEPSDNPGN